jgi:hypothetical protein
MSNILELYESFLPIISTKTLFPRIYKSFPIHPDSFPESFYISKHPEKPILQCNREIIGTQRLHHSVLEMHLCIHISRPRTDLPLPVSRRQPQAQAQFERGSSGSAYGCGTRPNANQRPASHSVFRNPSFEFLSAFLFLDPKITANTYPLPTVHNSKQPLCIAQTLCG